MKKTIAMKRDRLIQLLQDYAKDLAKKYDCPILVCQEDRQKGVWGESFTQYLENVYGECTHEFKFVSEESFIQTDYKGEAYKTPTPCRSIEFRFRFASPCLSIKSYSGQREILAEMELSDYNAETKQNDEHWEIGQLTAFQEEGMSFAKELQEGWHNIIKREQKKTIEKE